MKPLVRREQADLDVLEAIEFYLDSAPDLAVKFVDALEQALRQVQRQPSAGPPRYAHELNLPSLRFWLCKRFPYLVFYVETSEHIEIWRILHANRDIPAWLGEHED